MITLYKSKITLSARVLGLVICLIFALASCRYAPAAQNTNLPRVNIDLETLTGLPLNTTVSFDPVAGYVAVPPVLVPAIPFTINTTNGTNITYIQPWKYKVTVAGVKRDLPIISVPNTTNIYNLTTLITNGLQYTNFFVPSYLLKSGDTMEGPLTLLGDPTEDNHAVNKHYADQLTGAVIPSGTGLRKITNGVEVGTASLIVNADVDAAAAIDQSKISGLVAALLGFQTGSANLTNWTAYSPAGSAATNTANAYQATNANLTLWQAYSPAGKAATNAVDAYQATNANLTLWQALAPSAKQDANANLTAWALYSPAGLAGTNTANAYQATNANLTLWQALAPSAKQDASANLTAWALYSPAGLAGTNTANAYQATNANLTLWTAYSPAGKAATNAVDAYQKTNSNLTLWQGYSPAGSAATNTANAYQATNSNLTLWTAYSPAGSAATNTVDAYQKTNANLTSWQAITPGSKIDATNGTATGATLTNSTVFTSAIVDLAYGATNSVSSNLFVVTWNIATNNAAYLEMTNHCLLLLTGFPPTNQLWTGTLEIQNASGFTLRTLGTNAWGTNGQATIDWISFMKTNGNSLASFASSKRTNGQAKMILQGF